MIEPTQEDIGRRVVYTGNRYPGGQLDSIERGCLIGVEYGVIKIVTPYTVFVTYEGEGHSKGTRREDLEWADGAREQSAKEGEAA